MIGNRDFLADFIGIEGLNQDKSQKEKGINNQKKNAFKKEPDRLGQYWQSFLLEIV